MNPISAFFVRNIIAVFFFYGLAFFSMGLALALASQRVSEFKFVRAIRPLALFGVAHGVHEWVEMFQKLATLTRGYTPAVSHEIGRLLLLVFSFLMLSAFGIVLLSPDNGEYRRVARFVAGLGGLWFVSLLVVKIALQPSPEEWVAMADVLARYSVGVPGALLAAWALMNQQHIFRKHGMPQFGRDLVWCAMALIMYGLVGQAFVRQTALVPSNLLNSTTFLQWFGIPVQLFRGVMATILALFMMRALNAFEMENQQRIQAANAAKLQAQAEALEAERRVSREMERLNKELRLAMRELALLLSLSNLLATPMSLEDRLRSVLKKLVHSLDFPDAGLILLRRRATGRLDARAATGFESDRGRYSAAKALGQRCVETGWAMCRHADGTIIQFRPDAETQECRRYVSPVIMIALPLTVRDQVIGCVVLCRTSALAEEQITPDEFHLLVGIAEQLGLSIENARLYQEAQEREALLGNLLRQAVGAQESERQRIARELHDATGQSLTAIALGLRGVEAILDSEPEIAAKQIEELRTFTTNALDELRQLIADLRPSQLDDLGLIAALQWYLREFEKRFAIQTSFTVEGNRLRLPPEHETVLFRITQEALTNVAKHAHASHVQVKLSFGPTQVDVCIRDDGRGFDPDQVLSTNSTHVGWGLLGIQERVSLLGGRYQVETAPNQGTRVQVWVPLTGEKQDAQNPTAAG